MNTRSKLTNEKNPDVTLLITFHNEGILAHSTLNSIEMCRKHAEKFGLSTEYVWVLDSIDEETRRVLHTHPASHGNVRTLEVSHRDLGASRNSGISIARGDAIAILDGDDYFSTNWIERASSSLSEYGGNAIIHPEFVINFGSHNAYCWQVDQAGQYFNRDALLTANLWTSWTFAKRSTYLETPYVITRPNQTGFGYEDWHWNCETIAAGYVHRLAWGTVGFYRRKKSSLVTSTSLANAVIPRSQLFDRKNSNAGQR